MSADTNFKIRIQKLNYKQVAKHEAIGNLACLLFNFFCERKKLIIAGKNCLDLYTLMF